MAVKDTVEPTSNDLVGEVAYLREQLETLMRERVTPVVSDIANRAEKMMDGATDTVRAQADAVGEKVREQPLIAVAIAVGIGWLLGRAMR